jgi:uncharacterized membrane protein
MALLVAGLLRFPGHHLVPAVPARDDSPAARLGERGYKGAFSARSAIGLVLAASGDCARTALFGAFLAWAHDVTAVVAGIGAMLAFATLHHVLVGAQVVPFGP